MSAKLKITVSWQKMYTLTLENMVFGIQKCNFVLNLAFRIAAYKAADLNVVVETVSVYISWLKILIFSIVHIATFLFG